MRKITELEELKEIELNIMKKIHKYCEENEIKYYIAYGTLIGAIRHNGFIPWDDDIDIWMLRKDYEKFCVGFPLFAIENNLYLANSKTKPVLPRNMAKVCDKRTILKELEYTIGDDIGVFVDIWPLDGVPRNIFFRKFYFLFMRSLNYIFYAGIYTDEYFKGGTLKKMARYLCKIISPIRILNIQEYLVKQFEVKGSKYIAWNGVSKGFLYEEFRDRKLHKFEDTYFYVPSGYDSLLKKQYGNYMIEPPEEQQVPHHIVNTYIKD